MDPQDDRWIAQDDRWFAQDDRVAVRIAEGYLNCYDYENQTA